MSNEKAPVWQDEGENQTTTQTAEGSVMNTVPQTTDIRESPRPPIQAFAADEYDEARRTGSPKTTDVHESLRHLFETSESFDVSKGGAPRALPNGDALWIDQLESRFEPETMDQNDFFVIHVYRLADGKRVGEMTRAGRPVALGVTWWREQMGGYNFQIFGRAQPNTYITNGEHLFVSGGLFVRVGDTQEFRAWSRIRDERKAQADAKRDAWIAAHTEAVAAVQPLWATPGASVLEFAGAEVDAIEFRRELGQVAIVQMFEWDGCAFSSLDEPSVWVMGDGVDNGVYSADQAAHIGVDMAAAAHLLGASATVTYLRAAATAAGMDTGALYEDLVG